MNLSVLGITFTEKDLETIKLSELNVNSVSPAHLFMLIGGKPFLMLRAADFIDSGFINKYLEKGVSSFYALKIENTKNKKKYINDFSKLKSLRFEKEKIQHIETIFVEMYQDFWKSESQFSFIDFIIACYEEFYFLGNKVVNDIQSTSHILYSRAIQVGAHSVIAALASGYTDYYFIKDLYNACFALDYGLVNENFTYDLIKACEQERNNPQAGKESLLAIFRSIDERDAFFNHPAKTQDLLDELSTHFYFPELIWATRTHHEKVNGTGFPDGIFYSSISSWESVIQYADYIVPFEERIYLKADGLNCFKETFQKIFMSPHIKVLPVFKIIQNISRYFKWAEKKDKEQDTQEVAS